MHKKVGLLRKSCGFPHILSRRTGRDLVTSTKSRHGNPSGETLGGNRHVGHHLNRGAGENMAEQARPALSETVRLAWRLAAEEAVHAGQPQIEPIHLLLGICGVERVIRDEAWDRYSVSMTRKDTVNSEW